MTIPNPTLTSKLGRSKTVPNSISDKGTTVLNFLIGQGRTKSNSMWGLDVFLPNPILG